MSLDASKMMEDAQSYGQLVYLEGVEMQFIAVMADEMSHRWKWNYQGEKLTDETWDGIEALLSGLVDKLV